MKSLLLRIAAPLIACVALVGLAGCTGLTDGTMNLPVTLNAMRLSSGTTPAGFDRQYVNERASIWWKDNLGNDTSMSMDSARLKATLVNRTDSATSPTAAVTHIYVSDTEFTNASFVGTGGAVLLMDVTAPAGQSTAAFDSQFTAVGHDAGAIMQDGVFWVYAVSDNPGNDVELQSIDFSLKAKIALL